jgi:hypothetical protein
LASRRSQVRVLGLGPRMKAIRWPSPGDLSGLTDSQARLELPLHSDIRLTLPILSSQTRNLTCQAETLIDTHSALLMLVPAPISLSASGTLQSLPQPCRRNPLPTQHGASPGDTSALCFCLLVDLIFQFDSPVRDTNHTIRACCATATETPLPRCPACAHSPLLGISLLKETNAETDNIT